MTVRIINADVMDGLAQLADESVHCVVTSPPYWGLRDYGAEGQIGLEPTLQEHIDKLVQVFREARRVLRKDGTLWLNYGDAYAGGGRGGNPDDSPFRKQATNAGSLVDPVPTSATGLKPKDLLMMPERLALALQADGWWVRARIIWHKPNPMPESVTDRPTKSHEHIWLLSKAPRYYYDAEAIRESSETDDLRRPYGSAGVLDRRGKHAQGNGKPRVGSNRKALRSPLECRHRSSINGGQSMQGEPNGYRNARDVWTIATEPFPGSHFATMPTEVVRRCILAGTSEKGCCAECGAPWVRETTKVGERPSHSGSRKSSALMLERRGAKSLETSVFADGMLNVYATTGWRPSCTCSAGVVPCTVLDPFGGSGTTGLVADRLQRNAILIELNPQYAEMARNRLSGDAGMFANIQLEAAA